MDHLVCFLPGNLALGWTYLVKNSSHYPAEEAESLLKLAEELTGIFCFQNERLLYFSKNNFFIPQFTNVRTLCRKLTSTLEENCA